MSVIIARPNKIKRRRCTDVFFLILFLAALGLLGFVLFYAFDNGRISKVVYGIDYMSDQCSQDNSIEATGMPEVLDVVHDDTTLVETLWPFSQRGAREPFRLRRGMRDHRNRKLLYFTFPVTSPLANSQSVAICVDRCPTVDGNLSSAETAEEAALAAALEPSTWICTGRYLDGPPVECPGGQGTAPACKAYRESYYLYVPVEEAKACADPMFDCDICYPPYPSIQVVNFCMPDPVHALKAFKRAAVAVADLAVVLGGGGTGADLAGSLANGTRRSNYTLRDRSGDKSGDRALDWQSGTLRDLDQLRKSISSTPHLVYEDLVVSWPVIAGCSAAAFGFGLVWLVLLRLLAGAMVWVSLAALAVGMGFGAWWLYKTAEAMKGDERYGEDDFYTKQADYATIGFWVVVVIGSIYALLVVLLRRKIVLATRVVKAASRSLNSLPLLLLLPTVFMLLSLVIIFYGVYAALWFVSTGDLQLGRAGFGHITLDGWSEAMLLLHVACTLWLLFFVRHLQYCTIGGAVSQWYFKRKELGRFPVLVAFGTALRYHAGSVALGSLLITSLKLIRWAFLFLLRKSKIVTRRCPESQGKFAKGVCCFVSCCLACFEKFLRALCRYAYAQIMLSGHAFGQSAAEAFGVLTANLAGAATLRMVAAAYLALGKLVVAASCGAMGAYILRTEEPYKDELFSIVAPVTAIVLASLAVAMVFFGVYNMTIDTIFLCVCIEKDRKRLGVPTEGEKEVAFLLRDPDEPDAAISDPLPTQPRDAANPRSYERSRSSSAMNRFFGTALPSRQTATREFVPPGQSQTCGSIPPGTRASSTLQI